MKFQRSLWLKWLGSLQPTVVLTSVSLACGLLIALGPPLATAQSSSAQLDALEQQLLSQTYNTDPSVEHRLSRLEAVVFGQDQSGDTAQRIQRLLTTLHITPQAPSSTTQLPSEADAANQPEAMDEPTTSPTAQAPRSKDATDYPAVTDMERQLFRQSYAGEDIAHRLNRLEQHVFKRTYTDLPMVDRVDQLSLKLNPNGPLGIEEQVAPANPGFPPSQLANLPTQGNQFTSGSVAVYAQLKVLEERIIGQTFGGELIVDRLRRLEQIIFGAPQSGSVNDRISRLMSAPSRQRSANTLPPSASASNSPQVGQPQFYQSPPSYGGANGGNSSNSMPRSSNWYGAGRAPAPTNTEQFSPEMMAALPPHVRQSIQQRGIGGSTGRSIPLQGMGMAMVPPQQNSGQPMPQQAYPQSIGPGGSGPIALGPAQPLASTQRQAEYNQSIAMLEAQVFGRRFELLPTSERLNQLEKQVFGSTAPYYTTDRRIERLMNRLPLAKS